MPRLRDPEEVIFEEDEDFEDDDFYDDEEYYRYDTKDSGYLISEDYLNTIFDNNDLN